MFIKYYNQRTQEYGVIGVDFTLGRKCALKYSECVMGFEWEQA